MDRPLPVPNADTAPFWDGCAAGVVTVQRCEACGATQFPPRPFCTSCRSNRLTWGPTSGRATVASFTVVHRAPVPAFREAVPYVLALVDLPEGPRLMTNVVDCDPQDVRIGQAVRFVFRRVADGAPPLPCCVPDPEVA
ncbi:Zn-ribbon domain-containing OB-fold protein [Roseitalea porphyridii]|uniref:Zn-ribbon domain-containing OB-fold protein n=1 Tax=Roseitalea porphyridii TaxID=1852022 RepID=UPI0032EDCC51